MTGLKGDENVTPNILMEEDDDLNEQDVVNRDLAAQPAEDEYHMEAYFNQSFTIEYPFEDISDQQE